MSANPSAPSIAELLAEIVSNVEVGLHVWELDCPADPAGMRLIYANPAAEAATGISTARAIGRTLRDAFPEAIDQSALLAEVALGGAARSLGDVAFGGEQASGRTFSVRIFPLTERRVGVAFNNVTTERAAQAQALETLQSMSDGITMLDHEWRYTFLNKAGEQWSGMTHEEKLGKSIWELYPSLAGSAAEEAYRRAVRDNVSVAFEFFFDVVGKWTSVRAYPSPSGLTVYYRDITERKRLEAQLAQAQKLDAMGQLSSGIAHDFNNLLTVIDGYASLAQARLEDEPAFVGKALREITAAAASAAALTAKLLLFSRTQVLQTAVADLNKIVSSALELVSPLLGEKIAVKPMLDPDAGWVDVDVAQMEQVILNLVINARDAMDGGGNLSVETRSVDVDADTVPTLDAGRYAVISVRDDGCGMTDETVGRIFEPFFTTKPAGTGTGLGLSSVYGTVRQSGGVIDVASAPGEGTTFTIYLPRCKRPAVIPSQAAAAPTAEREGGRILVVEDEERVRGLICQMLATDGFEILEAGNAEQALSVLADGPVDLMVTDTVMPGDDGTTLAHAAVLLQPHLPVVYISGYRPQSAGSLVLEGSETTFVAKPFKPEQLIGRVHALLAATRRSREATTSQADAALTVLICDDTAAIRSVLRDSIAGAPTLSVVGEAADGEQAITEAQRLQPDVILLDLSMPVLSGLDALPELRRATPTARIVAFSGSDAAQSAGEALALGADAYVEKGSDVGTILDALRGDR